MRYNFPSRSALAHTMAARASLMAALVLLGGCATGPREFGRTAGTSYISYPAPPDTPRVQFLTTFTNSQDVSGKRGPSLLEALAGSDPDDEVGGFKKPYGIGFRDGRIHVCDVTQRGVVVVDARSRTFDFFRPRGEAALLRPGNCFTDPADGSLYVADMDRQQVVVFDSTLTYVGAFGEQEEANPTDVFVDGDRIYMTDMAGHKPIRVYDKNGFRHLRAFPGPESTSPARMWFPTHIYVRDDEVYVTDFGDFQVKVYSRDGEYLRSIGSFGRGAGQFVRPKGIAVDRDGILYVVDAGFENVQMFNREGELLMFFGGPYGGPGDMWLPVKVTLGYRGLELFESYVQPGFRLKHLILVTNQFGPDLINIYGFIEPLGVGGDEAP